MKKLILGALIFFFPIVASAEAIRSFESDIRVSGDGSFTVVENIEYDFEGEERHGIYRFIPTTHSDGSDKWFRERYVDVNIQSVTLDGQEVPYEVSRDMGKLEVKIGDPDFTISGVHTYQISYRVNGALYYYDSGEVDLYWNVTGHEWEVPIESATARIHDPEGVTLLGTSCYFGGFGENQECEVEEDEGMITASASLSSREGLTIAQSLDPSKVATTILERWSLWPLWLVGAFLWLLGLSWFLYRYYLEHQTGNTIIAQYEPYRDLRPMYSGLLMDGRVDDRDITAGIVYLAEQGFFKIREIEKKKLLVFKGVDHEIVLLRPFSELKGSFEKKIFELLFSRFDQVGESIKLSERASDTITQAHNLGLINELKEAAEKDLIAEGYFEYKYRKPSLIAVGLSLALLILLFINYLLGAAMLPAVVISSVTFVLSIVLLLITYRRRTKKGYRALDHLKGFKLFMSVTDEERFKFHNAPSKNPEQFMAYLPYAIAFGVEKEWAAVFKDVTIPNPGWYEGRAPGPFTAALLTQNISSLNTAVASASGYTASSGGGSSGGGAGGGGGGSW